MFRSLTRLAPLSAAMVALALLFAPLSASAAPQSGSHSAQIEAKQKPAKHHKAHKKHHAKGKHHKKAHHAKHHKAPKHHKK